MLIQTIKSEIISHLSYIIGNNNEAAVIDPRRDCEIYLKIANKWGAKINYIFETHRNEDYVTGSLELAKLTGATIFHGTGLPWGFGKTIEDNQQIQIGALKIKALHTPGHSPESTSYVLYDNESGEEPVMVFTGDTLFVGDVGRTDFLGEKMTPVMSEKMYNSITNKLFPLGEGVIVCPSHGAGSVCGGKIRQREISTIGIEKKTNPMLNLSKDNFIKQKTTERHQTPPYFKQMEAYNLNGPPILGTITMPHPLTPSEFMKTVETAYIIDTRTPDAFGAAHIKDSFSLPPKRLSNVGWIADYNKTILLVVENIKALEFAVKNLLRLGFDKIEGYLGGGIEAWYKQGIPIPKNGLITVHELKKMIDSKQEITILDVRRENEWNEGHIQGAMHIYLGHIPKQIDKVPRDKTIVVLCKTGNRSSFGTSILLRAGFENVYNCLGGTEAWVKAGFKLTK
ncbi:MAG: MBL fold metallo-hydrolase [Candidatus Bathyarchaeota archaeon]|nr:MBL fold metallo-hydrolase [Candidatus Bathyarchaeum tardum]WGM90133.1 MAG: MBL fold metallo-hydrolase [Candidatus Bathyarchaeum tardum]WNZ29733.1 MAG: MBL fold metallo-hydrolase [Candidatus Bathyarchaeota archaeon]